MRSAFSARLDTPAACLAALLVALSLFTFGQLARSGDPSAFIVAGDRFSDPHRVPPGVAVLRDSAGYDGQFYYRLALDPFTSAPTEYGITLDNPPYRHQRLLYPLIVHLVSLSDTRFVPVAMIAVNFVFFCVLAWTAGRLAQVSGRHALWGLLVVFHPGFLVSYSRDLVEIVEATFVLGSVLLMRRGRTGWATVALTLAVLTRETSLIVAVAAALVFVVERLRGRPVHSDAWAYAVLPIAAFCAVQGALFVVWGRLPVQAGSPVLGQVPLTGFTSSLSSAAGVAEIGYQRVGLAFVVLSAVVILYHLALTRAPWSERLACLLYGLLLASVGALVWVEDIAFLRVSTQFYLFGAIAMLASRATPAAVFMAALVGATWMFEFRRLGSVHPIVHFLRSLLGDA